jgi:flagella basal body P-ring formation protein FlgA
MLPPSLTAAVIAAALAVPALAQEPPIQPAQDILASARDYLSAAAAGQHTGRIEVRLGHLDPRLRLPRCGQTLQAFQSPGARLSGTTSVGVRCPDAAAWTIYVPAKIDVFHKALVTTRALAKGAHLQPGDVRIVETEVSELNQGYLQSVDEIQGLAARRPLPAGTVLSPSQVISPRLVRRGDRVTLVNMTGPIQVEMIGEAVSDAARGERIRVRALNSGKVVEGWVESAGVVKVTL